MKLRLILSLVFFISAIHVHSQSLNVSITDSVKVFLDKSLDIVQANAINRDSINWPKLRKQIYQKANGAKTYEDILPVYPYLFEQIADHHGALKFKGKSYFWKKSSAPYNNQNVISAVKKYDTVIVKRLSKHIGYILLPGNNDFGAKNINKDGQHIRNAIAAVNNHNIKSWIIDLRVNTGGNMYQMLAGLGRLLGDGKVGGFVNQHKQEDGNWYIKNGNIYIDSTQVSNITDQKKHIYKPLPIAVLISGRTASAGEIVAISTVARKNSVLIGEKTAGYTTANQGFEINKYAGLNLAIGFDADRTGKIYSNYISPDIFILGDNFENLEKDQKIIAAVKWLSKRR